MSQPGKTLVCRRLTPVMSTATVELSSSSARRRLQVTAAVRHRRSQRMRTAQVREGVSPLVMTITSTTARLARLPLRLLSLRHGIITNAHEQLHRHYIMMATVTTPPVSGRHRHCMGGPRPVFSFPVLLRARHLVCLSLAQPEVQVARAREEHSAVNKRRQQGKGISKIRARTIRIRTCEGATDGVVRPRCRRDECACKCAGAADILKG